MAAPVAPPPWPDLWEQWPLIEWDFAERLHLDAAELVMSRSFRWFTVRLMGLLTTPGTRLHSYFRRDDEPESDTPI